MLHVNISLSVTQQIVLFFGA